jgi:hypothetical protein
MRDEEEERKQPWRRLYTQTSTLAGPRMSDPLSTLDPCKVVVLFSISFPRSDDDIHFLSLGAFRAHPGEPHVIGRQVFWCKVGTPDIDVLDRNFRHIVEVFPV